MPVTREMLVTELQNLLRLTAFEQTIATVRRTQARTDALEAELAANVGKARERGALLAQAIREVGGVPDVVGATAGKVGALATAQLNQVQTLQGALLGDLTLEHQLRERTRYARTLARSLGETRVVPVLDRLEEAHSATIGWLEDRLAEVGRTGTSLLRATPLQAVVGFSRRLATAPLDATVGTVNRASALLTRLAGRTPAPLQAALASTVAGADAALDKTVHAARVATQRGEDKAVAVGTGVEGLADEARDAAARAAGAVTGTASQAAEVVEDAASTAAGTVASAAGTAAETVRESAGTAAETVRETAGTAAETVRESAETAAETAESAADTVRSAAGTAADATAEAAGTAADTASSAGTEVAQLAEQAKEAAAELEVVDLTGTGDVAHPFAGYEKLTGDRIMAHVRDTEDVAELQQVLAFESAHKARKGVLAAVQERLQELSANA